MLRYFLVWLIVCATAQARAADGIWVVVKNVGESDLEAVSLGGTLAFGNLRAGEYSDFLRVDGADPGVRFTAKSGATDVAGESGLKMTEWPYYLMEIQEVDGGLKVTGKPHDSYLSILLPQETGVAKAGGVVISGAVKREGFHPMAEGHTLTVAEALGLAGGMWLGDYDSTPVAGTWSVILHRVVNGVPEVHKLNLRESKGRAAPDGGFPVLPGDVIHVPICI